MVEELKDDSLHHQPKYNLKLKPEMEF